jgi:hypothetical protein
MAHRFFDGTQHDRLSNPVQETSSAADRREREIEMRLVKMLGLAAVATMAAMAFVGATSASAADTQLCIDHDGLACEEGASSVSIVNSGSGVLLGNLYDIACDVITASATPLVLADPQVVHFSSLSFASCQAEIENYPCESNPFETELPLANLEKIGLDAGVLSLTSGRVLLECTALVGWWECEYDLSEVQFTVGNQHFTSNETRLTLVEGTSFYCQEELYLDALFVTTANRYVLA